MPPRSFRLLLRLEKRSSAIVKCRMMKGEIWGSQGALKKMRSSGRPTIDIACPSTFLSTAPHLAISPPDAPRRKVSLQGVRDHDDSLARLKYLTFAVCSCFFSCSRRISSPPFLPKQQPNAAAAPLSQVDLSRQAQLPRPWWRFWQHHDIGRRVQASKRR